MGMSYLGNPFGYFQSINLPYLFFERAVEMKNVYLAHQMQISRQLLFNLVKLIRSFPSNFLRSLENSLCLLLLQIFVFYVYLNLFCEIYIVNWWLSARELICVTTDVYFSYQNPPRLQLTSLCIHKGIPFVYRQMLFRELQCLIETD
jgi:hypothetical protein